MYAEGGVGGYRRLRKAAPSVANRATAGVPAPTTQAVDLRQGKPDKGPTQIPFRLPYLQKRQPIMGIFRRCAPIDPPSPRHGVGP
jgi:hypothetical protein